MIITKITDQEMRHLGGAGREEPLKGLVTSDPDRPSSLSSIAGS